MSCTHCGGSQKRESGDRRQVGCAKHPGKRVQLLFMGEEFNLCFTAHKSSWAVTSAGRQTRAHSRIYSDEDIIRRMSLPKSVLCVSWSPSLASTREMLLTQAGYTVISALGEEEAASRCGAKAALLVLGHSVPRNEKQAVIKCFRQHCQAPVLSLLRPGQAKLPEADFAVEAFNPADFVQAVQTILSGNY